MASVKNYDQAAHQIIELVGGKENISKLEHCMTRLRFVLVDESKADEEKLKGVEGVLSIIKGGGQYQVVVGTEVEKFYASIVNITNIKGDVHKLEENENGKGKFNIIEIIASVFMPILGALSSVGLLTAFMLILSKCGVISTESTTYIILQSGMDAFLFFLPMFLAVSSAKRFGANQFTSMATAAILLYTSVSQYYGKGASLFGISFTMATFSSSVFPIIFGVAIQARVEKFLKKHLPKAINNLVTPAIVITLVLAVCMLVVGPLTNLIGSIIATSLSKLFDFAPALAGFLWGLLNPILTIFGMHYAMVPLYINNFATLGYDYLSPCTLGYSFVVAAACFAITLRSKDTNTKETASSTGITSFVAGVTEPGLYGVLLKNRRAFIISCLVNGIGGAFLAFNSFHLPQMLGPWSLFSSFAYAGIGGSVIVYYAIILLVLSFGLTFFFGVKRDKK